MLASILKFCQLEGVLLSDAMAAVARRRMREQATKPKPIPIPISKGKGAGAVRGGTEDKTGEDSTSNSNNNNNSNYSNNSSSSRSQRNQNKTSNRTSWGSPDQGQGLSQADLISTETAGTTGDVDWASEEDPTSYDGVPAYVVQRLDDATKAYSEKFDALMGVCEHM